MHKNFLVQVVGAIRLACQVKWHFDSISIGHVLLLTQELQTAKELSYSTEMCRFLKQSLPHCKFNKFIQHSLFVIFYNATCILCLQILSDKCFNSGSFSLQPGLRDSFPLFKSLSVACLHDKSSLKKAQVS